MREVAANNPSFMRYRCSACNAEYAIRRVEARATAVTARTCPWCGGRTLPLGIAQEDEIPARTVPFLVNREQAQEALRKFIDESDFKLETFDPHVEYAEPAFIPYWLFQAEAEGTLGIVAGTTGMGSSLYRAAWRSVRAGFGDMAICAFSHASGYHMDAVGPFSVIDSKPFSSMPAEEVAIQMPQVSADDATEQAHKFAKHLLHNRLMELGQPYSNTGDRGPYSLREVAENREAVCVTGKRLCSLPVWFLHCSWEGRDFLYLVNGQTGKCAGDVPTNEPKVMRAETRAVIPGIAIFLLSVSVIVYYSYYAVSGGRATQNGAARVFRLLLLIGVASALFIESRLASTQDDIARQTEAQSMAVHSKVVNPISEVTLLESWNSKREFSLRKAKRYLSQRA